MGRKNKEKGLHGDGHYMGKILHREKTIRKRNCIEKILHEEGTYRERRYIRKRDYMGRELHGEVITWGRDYTGR